MKRIFLIFCCFHALRSSALLYPNKKWQKISKNRQLLPILSVSRDGDTTILNSNPNDFDNPTKVNRVNNEDEVSLFVETLLGEEHNEELSLKVEQAMQDQWDLEQGVNTVPKTFKQPLKVNLDLWTYTARETFKSGNFTGAAKIYKQCIEYDPCDGRAWLGLARIHWNRRESEEAEKCYKDGLYYNPKNPFLLQGWAVMLEKMGRIVEAQKLLTVSVKSNPTHAASWVALASIHRRNGDTDSAKFCYSSAVKGDPRSYVALQAWGNLEAQSGDPELARDLFSRALRQSRKSIHSLHAWAKLEQRQGNLDKAEELLMQALSINPLHTRVRLGLIDLMEDRGEDPELIREMYEQGEQNAASVGDAGFLQAWAMYEQRQLVKTIKKIKKREEYNLRPLETDFEEITWEEKKKYKKLISSDENIALEEGLERIDNEEFEGFGEKDRVLEQLESERLKIMSSIRRIFKQCVQVNKFHSASWVAWAKFEQKSGNPEVARKLLITGISNFPHSRNIAWFHAALGNLSLDQKDIGTARACYQRALQSSPPQLSLPILVEFIRMETNQGSLNSAEKLLNVAKKRFPRNERVVELELEIEYKKIRSDK